MAIKGLTDRETLKPQVPRLGKLRKGGPKPSANKPGPDLDHFRFTSEGHPEIVEAFHEVYGNEPRAVNGVLFYDTVEENFSTWIECWDASGLVFRSDGEHWLVWRDGDQLNEGKKPHQDDPDQVEIGRLEFFIPELVQMGFRGTVTLETHSNHDLRNIASTLMALERERGTLRGAEIVIRRIKEKIGVPGWGDRKGQRSTSEKWLVKIELPEKAFAALAAPKEVEELAPGNNGDHEAVEGEYEEVEEEEYEPPEAPWYETDKRERFFAAAAKAFDVEEAEIKDVLGDELPATMKDAKTFLTEHYAEHWIEDDGNRRHWWGWIREQGVSHDEAHKALGVDRTADFDGSMENAKKQIRAWIREQSNEPDTDKAAEETLAKEGELPF